MASTPIRLPPPRTPRTWQVRMPKLPERQSEHRLMRDYAAYTAYLEQAGFERVHSVTSASHSSFEFRAKPPAETFDLFHHPEGLVLLAHSFTFGDEAPALGSLSVHAVVDTGTGPELQHRAASIRGSGSTNLHLDGSQTRIVSTVVHSNADALEDFLSGLQAHGRLLPLREWKDDRETCSIHVPPEHFVPLLSSPTGEPLKTGALYGHFDMHAAREAFLAALPVDLAGLLAFQLKGPEPVTDPDRAPRKGLRWDPVELGLKRFSEALFFAGKRWRGSFDHALLEHWSRVALGEEGDDPTGWRAFEAGPAGLSLPVALLYVKNPAQRSDALLRLLEEAPLDVLRRWATEPDASGYTLGLHVLNRAFVDRTLDRYAPDLPTLERALDVLMDRLGPEGLPMATETRSAMGLPLQFNPSVNDSGRAKSLAGAHRDFAALVAKLEGWGLPWDQHLRWRTYPNIFDREAAPPAFHRIDGPVTLAAWTAAMAFQASNELALLTAFLRQRELDAALPGPAAAPRRARM